MPDSFKLRLIQVGIFVGLIGSWELAARNGIIDQFFFPLPSQIAFRIYTWFSNYEIMLHIAVTLLEAALGFVAGMTAGVALGLWLALRPFASRVLEPYVKIFNAMPRVVLAPIFALWFGLGITSKVALVITLVLFIAFFNTYQGVREVNPVVLANARLLRASGSKMLRHIYVPSAMGWILSSLRVSIGLAITGAVVGEYLGSTMGIGNVIARAESVFDAVGVFAGLVILAILVIFLDKIIDIAERRIIKWRPSQLADQK